jgi:hypothetical protein
VVYTHAVARADGVVVPAGPAPMTDDPAAPMTDDPAAPMTDDPATPMTDDPATPLELARAVLADASIAGCSAGGAGAPADTMGGG